MMLELGGWHYIYTLTWFLFTNVHLVPAGSCGSVAHGHNTEGSCGTMVHSYVST